MGTIKINNIVYGSSNASEITYKSQTVEEKLDTIPIFDINDNGNVNNDGSDVLTYGHIIDNLESDADDKVLSAKQGKVLKNSLKNELEESINNLDTKITEFQNTFLNLVYPIGAIYLSLNNTNPGTLFGGTWEQLKDRFLLGAGDSYSVGSTGGAATHTLTVNEMPNHRHIGIGIDGVYVFGWDKGNFTGTNWMTQLNQNDKNIADRVQTGYTGGSQAHNNMPPYLTVYMWKRVS